MIRRSFLKACAALLPTGIMASRAKDVIVSVDRGDKGILSDANGEEVLLCVEANLTTGRCVVFKKDRNGRLIENSRTKVVGFVEQYESPMSFLSFASRRDIHC